MTKLAILKKCNATQKCTVFFLSVSTTDVGDSEKACNLISVTDQRNGYSNNYDHDHKIPK